VDEKISGANIIRPPESRIRRGFYTASTDAQKAIEVAHIKKAIETSLHQLARQYPLRTYKFCGRPIVCCDGVIILTFVHGETGNTKRTVKYAYLDRSVKWRVSDRAPDEQQAPVSVAS
jgi:hypothetical protein